MTDALYFDGCSTRCHPVTVLLHKGVMVVEGDGVRRTAKLAHLVISEPLAHAPRILQMTDGARVEVSDRRIDRLLYKNGFRDHWVVRWQQNWGVALGALCTLLALMLSAYQWGVPWAADRVARHLPNTLEQKIGDAQLRVVEAQMMAPTRLDPVDQQRLQGLFAGLRRPADDHASYRLEFRHSKIGPNAFALPNGVIIMTDQLVMLARDDQAILGVLAHELGHVQRRHALRRLVQGAGVAILVNVMLGDVSTIVTALPTLLLDQKYARDFEREADTYAIAMMQANAIPLAPLADLFARMGGSAAHDAHDLTKGEVEGARHGTPPDSAPPHSTFFSSHPSDAERIARLRAADRP